MKKCYLTALVMLTLLVSACQYTTFTPRNKAQKRREKPSIFVCEKIVEFRLEQGRWPQNRDDMTSKVSITNAVK